MIHLSRVIDLAYTAHRGQTDKLGNPYTQHLNEVSYGVEPFGTGVEMAAYLHDIVEDTKVTLGHLRKEGVPEAVLTMVEALTHVRNEPYMDAIERVSRNYGACLVKIADNAHNTQPGRVAKLDAETRDRLARKYRPAQERLWSAVAYRDAQTVLARVNSSLLPLLEVTVR